MKVKLTILLLIVFAPVVAVAQKWSLTGEIFYGTFKMESMKEYQQHIQPSPALVDLTVVDNFPAYLGYNVIAGYALSPRWGLGIRLQYTSTAGRVAYGDYSGEMSVDHLLHGYSIGLNTTYRLTAPSKWEAYCSFTAGAMRTSLTNAYRFQLYGESPSVYEVYFRSYNYFFNPALTVNRRLNNHFTVYASLGYEFQIHRALRFTDHQDQYLKTWNGSDDVVAEWDGLRIAVGTSYRFRLSKKD